MLRRWASIVRGLKNSCAATSLEVAPVATSRAMCSSWAVSASAGWAVRLRGCSPVARSSRAGGAARGRPGRLRPPPSPRGRGRGSRRAWPPRVPVGRFRGRARHPAGRRAWRRPGASRVRRCPGWCGTRSGRAQRGQPHQEPIRRVTGTQPERHPQRRPLRGGQPAQPIQQRHAQLMQPREREVHLRLHPGRAHHPEPRGGAARVLQQRGLTDAGLAAHHQHAATPGPRPREQLLDRRTLGTPPQQHSVVRRRAPAGVRHLSSRPSPCASIPRRFPPKTKRLAPRRTAPVRRPHR
jgi:hypothetical protein